MSIDSCDSREPVFVVAGDIRRRLSESINAPQAKHGFKRDPEDPSASILKEPWHEKGDRNTSLENKEYELPVRMFWEGNLTVLPLSPSPP
jgi:hypothetical protein